MKVLQIGARNYPPAHGGTERLVADLVGGLTDCESHVFVEEGPGGGCPRVRQLPRPLWRRWLAVRRHVRENDIDLVHLHKSNSAPLGLLLKLGGIKCILTVHGCGWRRGEKRWNPAVKAAAALLDLLASVFLDRVVLVGEHDWLSFQRFLPSRKLRLIRNGVAVGPEPSTVGRRGWVYVGRISPEKNILKLLEAAVVLPERLTLYGPIAPANARFEAAFRKALENANAEWKGPLRGEHVRNTLSRYQVFVNPSWTEGLPFTVLEAAAEGLHLVLSDIRPHRLLGFPACDYVDPAHLSLPAVLRTGCDGGQANRAHVRREYDRETMLRSYRALYDEVAGSPVPVSVPSAAR